MPTKISSLPINTMHRQRCQALIFICILFSTCFIFSTDRCTQVHKAPGGLPFPDTATFSSYNNLGLWYIHRGENACALQSFLAAVGKDGSSWDANFNVGRTYIKLGHLVTGSTYLAKAVALSPSLVAPRIIYGEVEEKLDHAEQAERIYRDGLAFDPESSRILDHLASLLAKQGEYKAAIHYWHHAISLNPGNKQYQLALGVAYTNEHEYPLAILELKKLIKGSPDFEPAYFSLGSAYARQGEFTQAENTYQAALKLDPHDGEAQLSQAKVFITLLRYYEARSLLTDYIGNHPNDPAALTMIGRSDYFLGHLKASERELRKAAEMAPRSYDAQYYLGLVLKASGRQEEGMTHFKNAISIHPDSLEAHFQLAKAYRALHYGRLEKEQVEIVRNENATNADKTKATILGNDGMRAFSAGDLSAATQSYASALALDPKNARLYYDISLVYGRLDATDSERKALLQAEQLDPSFALARNQLGMMYSQAGETSKARNEFLKAIEIDPDYVEALSNLGVILARQGNPKKAQYFLHRAIESDPAYTKAYVNLGLILATEGRLSSALHVENAALTISPNDRNAQAAKSTIEAAILHDAGSAYPGHH